MKNRRQSTLVAVVFLAALSLNAPGAIASQITIGSDDGTGGNLIPFGSIQPVYQQAYSSTFFPGPVTITGLTFSRHASVAFSGSNTITPGVYTFRLSTTSKPVGGLDVLDLAENLGANNQLFFSGILTGTPATLTISGTPFLYNPAEGNLLLEIAQTPSAGSGGIFFDAMNGTAGNAISRAGGYAGEGGYGLVTIFTVTSTVARLPYIGVNLAGAEFGVVGGALPGTYGTHYTYPTRAEAEYYVGKGMNTFRLTFRWERLQRELRAPLDGTELNHIRAFVDDATRRGANVILVPHNFARYNPDISSQESMQSGPSGIIGSDSVPISAFEDFWKRVALEFKDNHRVFFNLMNEPNEIGTQTWVDAANAAIAAIRGTGATNLILVPGINWTGAHSWSNSGSHQGAATEANATAMLRILDSGNNYAFEVHQYMNDDSSGGSEQISNDDPNVGVRRVSHITNWLRTHNRRAFLGEFAVANCRIGNGPTQIGDETVRNLLDYLEDNGDVWLGWTWWAGGPWWTDYMFSPEPRDLGSTNPEVKPVMSVLRPESATGAPLPHFVCGKPVPERGDFDGDGNFAH